jgi:hypothetical protein
MNADLALTSLKLIIVIVEAFCPLQSVQINTILIILSYLRTSTTSKFAKVEKNCHPIAR